MSKTAPSEPSAPAREALAHVADPAERLTPRLDAWLARLRATFDVEPGAQADLARHLGATNSLGVRLWTAKFSRWLRRRNLPDAEEVLAVEEWLATRRARGRPRLARGEIHLGIG